MNFIRTGYDTIFTGVHWPNHINTVKWNQLHYLSYQGVKVQSSTNPALMDGWSDTTFYQFDKQWPALLAAVHAAGAKLLLTLYAGDELLPIVSNATLLSQLVKNLWACIATGGHASGADGLELDWESVDAELGPKDVLINALYASKPSGKIISHTATWIRTDISQDSAAKVDLIQIMCYDMSYSPATGRAPYSATYEDSIAAMQRWATYPKSKIIMLVPAYGEDGDGFHFMYNEIAASFPILPSQSEVTASTINVQPSRAFELGGNPVPITGGKIVWSGFDETKRKVKWVMDNGFGGVGIFDVGVDNSGMANAILQAIYDESVLPTPTTTGLMVPLYIYPGVAWDTVIASKVAHPSVPVAAILNSNSGPGTAYDATWNTYINRLVAAGVVCYGYVWCGETNEFDSNRDCTQDVARWKSWYPQVTAIFVDGFQGGYAYPGTAQVARARTAGYTVVMGNPGMAVAASLLTSVDEACVYETTGVPSLATMQSLANTYGASRNYFLPYGVATLDTNWVTSAKNYCKWLYLTNDTLTNPWDTLPLYFGDLVAALDEQGGSMVTITAGTVTTLNAALTPNPPTPTTGTLSGKTTNSATGAILPGVTVVIGSLTTTSDSTGNYSIPNVPPGQYSVTFSKSGFTTLVL